MHPSSSWAGVIAKLLEHPELIGWMIFLLVIITVAILLTMKAFVNQTPARRRDIIKLVQALLRHAPKP
jgi:hypothetical protein